MSIDQPARPRRPRRVRLAALAAASVAALAACPPPALALFGVGDVVSDPSAKAKNVQKVAAMLAELQEMARQLDLLQRQVADLGPAVDDPGGDGFDRAGQAMAALTAQQQTLARWSAQMPADADPQSVTIDALPARTAQARAYLKDRVAGAEASLATVEQDRERVTVEVAATVRASNAAEGPKAAQQATNDLQAIAAAEQAKLEALRAVRNRLRVDRDATAQAEEAAAEAVRQREMAAMRQSYQTLRADTPGVATGGRP